MGGDKSSSVAVVGAGIAGAACAAGLTASGIDVTVFDRSSHPGGRMASRRVDWPNADGTESSALLDHGTQQFEARHPRFRSVVGRAQHAGVVAEWAPRLHGRFTPAGREASFVALPDMPSLCRHLLAGARLRLGEPVSRLQRRGRQWHVCMVGGSTAGPFDRVVLAMPPVQAALLTAGLHDDWTDTLAAANMQSCWTFLAVTDDVDWPWDAAVPESGLLARVTRCDRKPGRQAPAGLATWVAHAQPDWSAERLECDAATIAADLRPALQSLLPCRARPLWHHVSAHRWRYAWPAEPLAGIAAGTDCLWDPDLGLGICGDYFANGSVEDAWRSGDELADTIAVSVEQTEGEVVSRFAEKDESVAQAPADALLHPVFS